MTRLAAAAGAASPSTPWPAPSYRIAVDGKGGDRGSFELDLSGAPANDAFSSPSALGSTSYSRVALRTAGATKEAGEPDHAGQPGGHSVWYSWTAPASKRVTIDTCGSNFDSVLAVYTGSAVAALTPVAADDDGAGCGPGLSELSFDAVAGTAYRIAVDGRDASQEGAGYLSIAQPPANDDFAAAGVLSGDYTWAEGTTAGAGSETGEPDHAGQTAGHSVWYRWTPATSGRATIYICGADFDSVLGVYTGNSVGGLTEVAAGDDGYYCDETDAGVEFDAVGGTTYRIAVDGKAGQSGWFDLEVEKSGGGVDVPENNDLASATTLAPEGDYAYGETNGADHEPGEPQHAGDPGGSSVWFDWTPTESGPVEISSCYSGFDTLLAVYTGATMAGLTEVAANDDGTDPWCGSGSSSVVFRVTAGTTYRIALDGKGGSAGWYELYMSDAAYNDDFADAAGLGVTAEVDTGGTNLATKEAGEPNHAGDAGGASVWFKWTAPETGRYRIATCGSTFDSLLGVYTGSSLSGLTEEAAGDDGSCVGGGDDAAIEIDATAGNRYWIAIDGKGAGIGSYRLVIDGRPANDDFVAPRALAKGLPDYTEASTRLATREAGEPAHAGDPGARSVWFKWTAPRDMTLMVDACSSDFDTLLAVYEGSSLATLNEVAAADDVCGAGGSRSAVRFSATAGTTYRIAIDGAAGASGRALLQLWEWTGPQTYVVDGPESPTAEAAPRFTFSSDTPGATFECRFDGAAFGPCSGPGATHAEALTEGSHTFAVRSTAHGVRDTSPATQTFLVDRTAPDTALTTWPPATTSDTTPTFTFSSEPGAQFECRVDTAAFGPCSGPGAAMTLPALSLGQHTFEVRAKDRAGNVDATPASRTIEVTVPLAVTIDSGPSGDTNDTTPTFGFSLVGPDSIYECSFGGPFIACSGPGDSHTPTAPLGEGDHEFVVRASDGFVTITTRRFFTVDTTAPTATITSGPANGSQTYDRRPLFGFSSSESDSSYLCAIDGAPTLPCARPASHLPSGDLSYGAHYLTVVAVDPAGNRSAPQRTDFTVLAPVPPQRADTRITKKPARTVFTRRRTAQVSVSFVTTGPVARVECRMDLGAWVPCRSPHRFRVRPGRHAIRIRAWDTSGLPDPTPAVTKFTLKKRR